VDILDDIIFFSGERREEWVGAGAVEKLKKKENQIN